MTFRTVRFLAAILAGSAILATNNAKADFVLGGYDAASPAIPPVKISEYDLGELLYKNERDGDPEDGLLKDSYSTTYHFGVNTGSATITWVEGQPKAEYPTYLLAKAATISLVWPLLGWNGTDPIDRKSVV